MDIATVRQWGRAATGARGGGRQRRPAEAAAWVKGVWAMGEPLEDSAVLAASEGAKAARARPTT